MDLSGKNSVNRDMDRDTPSEQELQSNIFSLFSLQRTPPDTVFRLIFWLSWGGQCVNAISMEAKSLPEQYKHLLHFPSDVFTHMIEEIEMLLILAFFPTHL